MLKSNIIFAFISLVFATASFGQINFKTATYEEMISNAQKTQMPFFIVFGFEECAICKKMEQNTYIQPSITEYVNQNLTPYKVDALSFDGIGIAQHFGVTQFPTIMVFNEKGARMCVIRGYNTADALIADFRSQMAIINRLKDSGNEMMVKVNPNVITVPQFNKTEYEEVKKDAMAKIKETEESGTISKYKLEDGKVELSAPRPIAGPQGKPAASASNYGVVEGLEAKSVMSKHPQGFGIQISSVASVAELNAEVAKYSKRWKKDIWVYSQTINGNTTYYLLFGTFEDQESANDMSQMMSETLDITGSTINLNSIK